MRRLTAVVPRNRGSLPEANNLSVQDSSRSALDLVHRLLSLSATELPGLDGLLAQLVTAFGASAAGLAALPDGKSVACADTHDNKRASLPLEIDDAVLTRLEASGVLVFARGPHSSLAVVVAQAHAGPAWLVWIEDEQRCAWTRGETAALALFATVLAQKAGADVPTPRWLAQRERFRCRQRLEESALVVRRLTHDYGNALTAILGFAELSLCQKVDPRSTLYDYLRELQQAAKDAAQWNQLLQLFSLSQSQAPNGSCSLSDALRAEERSQRKVWKTTAALTLDVPRTLPSPAIAEEPLRRLVAHAAGKCLRGFAGQRRGRNVAGQAH